MPKTYDEFMKDISADELYDRMIQYGMFAEKLPPVFDGASFLAYCKDPSHPVFADKWHDYVRYDSMRNINIPRPLGIPTPMGHERLCKCLKDEWLNLQQYFQTTTANQKHIVSRIHIRKANDTDASFQMNYSNWRDDGTPEPDLLMGKQYMVSADISKCFPSIYTHAIPWALVGKPIAKQNATKTNQWYNQIDHFAQNSKNGETHSLLIGPHTSNLLSEIILCKIDETLCKKWDYTRHIDDFCCFVKTHDDADQFLVDLNACLKEYGLSLNHKKTKIEALPAAMTEQWVRKLQKQILPFGKFHDYVDYHEVQVFIDFCVDLMSENKDNASILLYGMKVLKGQKLTQNAQQYFTKMSVSLALIYPYIVPLLDECVFTPCSTDPAEIEKYLNLIYEHYFAKNYFEACSFALYYATKYDFEISSFDVNTVISKEDCIFDLMALIYCRKRKQSADQKTLKNYAKQLKANGVFDEFWLFAYESLSVGLVTDDWKGMKKANVSFLKPEYQ